MKKSIKLAEYIGCDADIAESTIKDAVYFYETTFKEKPKILFMGKSEINYTGFADRILIASEYRLYIKFHRSRKEELFWGIIGKGGLVYSRGL